MAGAISNMTTSIKGMFMDGAGEKAILYIYLADFNKMGVMKDEITAIKNLEKGLMKKVNSKLSIKDVAEGAKSGILDTLMSVIGSGSGDKLGATYKETINYLGQEDESLAGDLEEGMNTFFKFKVQYNPATIRLSSVNGRIQSRRADEGIDNLKVYNFSGKSKLSFDLIFDDTDNMNAFGMNELTNMNVTSAVNKGINTLVKGKEGLTGDYSVKPKMDAILSLLCSNITQEVVFFWSKMVFRGTITDVSNRFTMFNSKGNPVRGEMHLELTQDKKKVDQGYDDSYWDKAFNDCFEAKSDMPDFEGVHSSASTWTNNSLVNISL